MKRINSLVAVALVMAAMMVAMAMPAIAAQPRYTCEVTRFDGLVLTFPDQTPKQVAKLKKDPRLTSLTCTRQA